MTSSEPSIRRMVRPELDLALDWAAAEGWNPGLRDADCFYAADARSFFIGEVAGIGPVGCVSAVAYGDAFGFLGFYIVKPEHRGKGYGIRLWRAAMEYMGGRTVGLDGVPAQQANYERSGYCLAFRNIRWEGLGQHPAPAVPSAKGHVEELIDLAVAPFADLADYDARHFLAPRTRFLECWIDQPQGAALAATRQSRIVGYGVLRPCRNGFKIGPLFADDEQVAAGLFDALVARVPGEPIFLDTPEPNAAALALVRARGLQPVFETARMYRGKLPALPVNAIFGVTSFELG